MERKTNMATSENDLAKRVREAPINYALLKLIHHEFGNGLAVLSGYRHLLQQAISTQAQEPYPPTRDVWQYRNEHWLGYLQTMQGREMRLHNLLFQLRELASDATDEPLCQSFVRTDLVVLLGRVIEQRLSLCPDHILQVSMPVQPLFIMCDPFWIQVLFEHLLNYIVVGHADTMPAEIHLEPFPNPMGREAKITLRLRSDLPRLTPGRDGEFEAQIRVLEQGETEGCLALCHEILHEHGGRIWSEQEGSISLALPLAEERKGRL
jgi:signal transduction histidine kinase